MWIARLLMLLVFWAVILAVTWAVPVRAEQRAAQPGVFDYYVLNLSWSPEFCYSNARNPECALDKHFGFIVHGLWPQFRQGGGPTLISWLTSGRRMAAAAASRLTTTLDWCGRLLRPYIFQRSSFGPPGSSISGRPI
jgi:hypothetical protein